MEEKNKTFKTKNFMRSTFSSQSKQNNAKKAIMTSLSPQSTRHQHNKENDDVTMIKEMKRKTCKDEVTMAKLKLKKIHDDVIIRKTYVPDNDVIKEQKAEQPPQQEVVVSPEMEKMKIRMLCLEKIIKNLKVKNKKLQIIIKQQRAEQQKEKQQKAQQQKEQSESRISKLDFHPIRDLLGSGDVTTTYSGRYGNDDVIVKRFKAPMTSSDVIYAKAECEMLRGLRHHSIVGIITIQCDISDCYVIMEMTEGGKSLQEILLEPENSTGMNLENFLPICTSAATGMKYLHENQPQILHLNLKPSNIIVERDGENSRIQDFAFSKLRSRPVTSSSMVYLAPEMTSHPVHISSKNDVFAFAQIMRRMARGMIEHPQQKFDDVTRDSSSRNSSLPENLTFLMELCADRDFRRRPNFADIVDNLKEIALQRSPFVTSSMLRPVENFLANSNRGDVVGMTSSIASSSPKKRVITNDVTTMRVGSEIQTEFASNMESIKKMFDRRFNGYIHEVESTCRKLTSSYDVITTRYDVNRMTSPKKLK